MDELLRKIELTAEIWKAQLIWKEVKKQNFIFVFHVLVPDKVYPENIEIRSALIIPLVVKNIKENPDKLVVMIPIEFKENINGGIWKYINKILLDFTKIGASCYYYITPFTPIEEIVLDKGIVKGEIEKWYQKIIFQEGEGDDFIYKELPPGCLLNGVNNPAYFSLNFLKRLIEGESFCRYCDWKDYCPNQKLLKNIMNKGV
jgi:hypothetical protein